MKKLVILFFSCAIQITYGSELQNLSEPNSIQGSMESDILANAKSPMARRDPRLFFGVSYFVHNFQRCSYNFKRLNDEYTRLPNRAIGSI